MTAGLFPDSADVLCDVLAGFGDTGVITPPNLETVLPFIRTGHVGGSDDLVTDRTTVDVDVFAGSITASNLLGERVRQFLLAGPHVAGGVVLDLVRTVSGPRQFPWPTAGVFRCSATYRVSARRSTV